MKKKLQLLEQLQLIDTAIDEKRQEEAAHSSTVSLLEQSVDSIVSELSLEQERMGKLEAERLELEKSLEAELESIKRSESHMKEIRTNKEYQAVGREIAAARKQVSELEEQILQKAALAEEIKNAMDARSVELLTKKEDADTAKKAANEVISRIVTEIETSMSQREHTVKGLPSSVVRRYDQLRKQRRGQAIAEARDGSCQGCNMNLPPQLYNMLFKGDELHFCPHCQRILILRQAEG